jgi:hypothetical protein
MSFILFLLFINSVLYYSSYSSLPYSLCFSLSRLLSATFYFDFSDNKYRVMLALVTMILILNEGKVE